MLYSALYPLIEYYPHLVQVYYMKRNIQAIDEAIAMHRPNFLVDERATRETSRLHNERSQYECIHHSRQLYLDQVDKNAALTETRKEFEFICTFLKLDYVRFLKAIGEVHYAHQKERVEHDEIKTVAWMNDTNYSLLTVKPHNLTDHVGLVITEKDTVEIVNRRLKIHRLVE